MHGETQFEKRIEQVEKLVRELEAIPDAHARGVATELLQTVMELHGAALERMLQILREQTNETLEVMDALTGNDLVGSVLLLHDLHPLKLDVRVQNALENIDGILRGYNARVEILGTPGGSVRLHVRGVTNASIARAVQEAIEDEIYRLAPDTASLTILGLEQFTTPDFIPLDQLLPAFAPAGNPHIPANAMNDGS